ncbi:hypothetical protein ACJD0Z_11390 [Flavobacteriaceae bacterium M23B6Z8]
MKIISQLQSNRWKILMISIISIFLISLVVLLKIWKGIPIANLTRDITAIAALPPYTGFFSQIGSFFWIATSTLSIFSASVSFKDRAFPDLKKYLYLSGLLTLFLCLDDIFLLHEQVFPYFGIPEKLVFAVYGLIILSWAVKFYAIILKTDYILLLMSFSFLGLSVILDVFEIPALDPYLYEDGAKMIGIVCWFFYFYSNAMLAISSRKE